MAGRLSRWLRVGVAVAALGLATPAGVRAQEEGGEAGSSEGSPYYGYIGTGVVLAMIAFAVCKSARR
jgi:hypothetical protein